MQRFIEDYPGTVETAAAEPNAGLPVWVGVQHFLNLFLMIFIIRSGRADPQRPPSAVLDPAQHSGQGLVPHPEAGAHRPAVDGEEGLHQPARDRSVYRASGTPSGWPAGGIWAPTPCGCSTAWSSTSCCSPPGSGGVWCRSSWDVFPNAVSVLIQYLSLDWPTETGWVAYNSLQLIAYFITVFVAAPLALHHRPRHVACAVHPLQADQQAAQHPDGTLAALPRAGLVPAVHRGPRDAGVHHRAAAQPQPHLRRTRRRQSWAGFWIFAASMVVVIVGWVAATPFTLRHPRVVQRVGYALIGPVQRLFEHVDSTPGEYTEKDISPTSGTTGSTPTRRSTRRCSRATSPTTGCGFNGLVDNPVELDLVQLRALPHHEQITQHFCIQGWSGIAKWGGVSMQTIMDLVKPQPEAKWVVFYSLGDGSDKGIYYDAHPIEQMSYHLTMLAYDMNGEPLSFGHGAPLRLRNEIQLGFKQVKWIKGVEFVADFSEIGGGYGGYNQDHEFFGYRQSL
ncbi:MAG: molybdopterin-dependent oxidoreductase [Nocardioidaceae bacterium]